MGLLQLMALNFYTDKNMGGFSVENFEKNS